jgi:hypothetical protein
MNSSNLAERFEELDSVIQSLQLRGEPSMRLMAAPEVAETLAQPARPARRVSRLRAIQTRDQGLRSFRVF